MSSKVENPEKPEDDAKTPEEQADSPPAAKSGALSAEQDEDSAKVLANMSKKRSERPAESRSTEQPGDGSVSKEDGDSGAADVEAPPQKRARVETGQNDVKGASSAVVSAKAGGGAKPGPPLGAGASERRLEPGDRIAVYWPMEKKNFTGTLLRENSPGQWVIQYDDGDVRLHALRNDNWQYYVPADKGGGARGRTFAGTKAATAATAIPTGPGYETKSGTVARQGQLRSNPMQVQQQMRRQPQPQQQPQRPQQPVEGYPQYDYIQDNWGQSFERAKHVALGEVRILMGLLQYMRPTSQNLYSLNHATTRVRSMIAQINAFTQQQQQQQQQRQQQSGYLPPGVGAQDGMYTTPEGVYRSAGPNAQGVRQKPMRSAVERPQGNSAMRNGMELAQGQVPQGRVRMRQQQVAPLRGGQQMGYPQRAMQHGSTAGQPGVYGRPAPPPQQQQEQQQ